MSLGGVVVLDLGFTTKSQRSVFVDLAEKIGATSEVHYLTPPVEIHKAHVKQRNIDKDPNFYSFEVTDFMFHIMESKIDTLDES